MDELTRKANKIGILQALMAIEDANKAATAERNAHRTRTSQLQQQKDVYQADHLKEMMDKADSDARGKIASMHAKVKAQHATLKKALLENNSELDLSDSKLANAASLIKSIGPELDFDSVSRINERFAHDQPSLRVLKAAYRSANVIGDGGLDRQLYDIEGTLNKIDRLGETAFLGGGSLNQYAAEVKKLAALEGHEQVINSMPDEQGSIDVMRKAAGLPVGEA
jgi:hypothetical protein